MALQDPPYKMISDDLRRGRIVPFLGAGASLTARPQEATWRLGDSRFPPSGAELSNFLAEYVEFPKDEPRDLAKVASYVALVGGRQRLSDYLIDVFKQDYEPGSIHEFLATLDYPILIVTTNYDDLIEQAFARHGKPCHVVHWTNVPEVAGSVLWWSKEADEPEPYPAKELPLQPGTDPIIYKIHGTVDRRQEKWDSFLITEEDYIDFLARMTRQGAIPATFKQHFKHSSFLFLGYGLGDWNLRVLLQNMKSGWSFGGGPEGEARPPAVIPSAGELKSWAVQRQPSTLESALWRTRHVDIYDVDLNEFVTRLQDTMGMSH